MKYSPSKSNWIYTNHFNSAILGVVKKLISANNGCMRIIPLSNECISEVISTGRLQKITLIFQIFRKEDLGYIQGFLASKHGQNNWRWAFKGFQTLISLENHKNGNCSLEFGSPLKGWNLRQLDCFENYH